MRRCPEKAKPCGRLGPCPDRIRSKCGNSARAPTGRTSAESVRRPRLRPRRPDFPPATRNTLPGGHRNLRQHCLVRHAVVAVGIRGRHVTLIAPEKKHAIPRQSRAGIRGQQVEETLGSRAARERDREAAALPPRLHSLGERLLPPPRQTIPAESSACGFHRICSADFPHNSARGIAQLVTARTAAHRAAPSSPSLFIRDNLDRHRFHQGPQAAFVHERLA